MKEHFKCLNANFRLLKTIYVHLLVCYLNKLQNAWCNVKDLSEKFAYDLHLQWSTKRRKCKASVLSWVAYRQTFATVLRTEHCPSFLRLWTTLYLNCRRSTFWHLMGTIQQANTSPNFLSEEIKYNVDHWDKCCNFCCDFVEKERLFCMPFFWWTATWN